MEEIEAKLKAANERIAELEAKLVELEKAPKAAAASAKTKPGPPSFADLAAKHNALLAEGKHDEAADFHKKKIATFKDATD